MGNQLISIGFGKETFSSTSASLSAFVVTEEFVRVLPSKSFQRQGILQKFPVSQHPEVNGYLFLDSLKDVPDGTIILLQASHRYNASPLRDAGVFIALRSTGPLLSVNAKLVAAREATRTGTFLVFQGRGDILPTLREVKAHGIRPHKNYVGAFMDDEEIAECYTISVTAPELEEKPRFEQVVARDGEVVALKQKPSRKIALRRPG